MAPIEFKRPKPAIFLLRTPISALRCSPYRCTAALLELISAPSDGSYDSRLLVIDPLISLQALGQLHLQQKTQTFSTCAKSSSTGVARPKIVTETRTFDFS